MKRRSFLIAATGASGMLLTQSLLDILSQSADVYGVISEGAIEVIRSEQEPPLNLQACCKVFNNQDIGAGPASGSWWRHCEGMILIPCSMSTLGAIACGLGQNLIQRAAQTALKESKKLVLVARESPLSLINLRNMCAVKEAGGIIMPFCPAFYFKPETIKEILEHFCQRILDQLDVAHDGKIWGFEQTNK